MKLDKIINHSSIILWGQIYLLLIEGWLVILSELD